MENFDNESSVDENIELSFEGNSSLDVNSVEYKPHIPVQIQIVISILYTLGVLGNLWALIIIVRKEKRRFQRQIFMIKCLALNDLTALLGSAILMCVLLYCPSANKQSMCVFRVLLRSFGLGSGCIALVMAIDRWLALSHAFIYQSHVTNRVIRRAIVGLWSFNVLLVCAPFFGIGVWFKTDERKPCVRYRNGTSLTDKIYAHVMFSFGMNMCLGIVGCNLSVIRALCFMKKRVTRKFSRSSCRSTSSSTREHSNLSTPEEESFARLMGILSIFFVICWVPQLLTIIAAQYSILPLTSPLYRAADVLIALNFCLDPYIYVLFRRQQICTSRHFHKVGESIRSFRTRPTNNNSYVDSIDQTQALSNGSQPHESTPVSKLREAVLCDSISSSQHSDQCEPLTEPGTSVCSIGSSNRVSFKIKNHNLGT